MKFKMVMILCMFGLPLFGQATKQLVVPTQEQYLKWGATGTIMPTDLNKRWAGQTIDGYDFSNATFQQGTNFSGCTITNCKLFGLKKSQSSLVQIQQPECICIPTVGDLPDLPPLPPLPAPGQPLPPLPPLPSSSTGCATNSCKASQNPVPQAAPQQVAPESVFIGADFTNAVLTGTTFFDTNSQQGADLSQAKLSSAHLEGVNFTDCIFNGTDFAGLSLKQVNLSGVDVSIIKNFSKVTSLDNAILDFVHAPGVQFPFCSAQNISIRHAHLEEALFGGAFSAPLNYAGADFTGSNLTGTTFWYINPYRSQNAPAQGDTSSSCMLFTSCTMGRKSNSSAFTSFHKSNLHGSSFTGIMAPCNAQGEFQQQLAGVLVDDCDFSCVIADDLIIGNVQVKYGDSYGTVYTDIKDKKADLNNNPWIFTNTSLYGAHFTANRDYYDKNDESGNPLLSDFGKSTIDADTLIEGARFEQLKLCNASINADTTTAFARDKHSNNVNDPIDTLANYLLNTCADVANLPGIGS